MELCAAHASSVASAVGGSLSQGCMFATLYVSEEAAAAAAAAIGAEAGPGAGAEAWGGAEAVGTEAARKGDRKLASDGGDSASIANNADSEAVNADGAIGLPIKRQNQDESQDHSQDHSQVHAQDLADVEGKTSVGAKAKGGWLQAMVDECRLRMEERFPQEKAEAVAEVAGRSGGGDGGMGDEDEDSAEDGWTSDPEELAKEAARKARPVRRFPILPIVVPSLPRGAAVELEVVCLSRSALALLPCAHYPPSILRETLTAAATYQASAAAETTTAKTMNCPVPARFRPALSCPRSPPPPDSLERKGAAPALAPAPTTPAAGSAPVTLAVTTTGSSVDRILSIAVSSLRFTVAEMGIRRHGGSGGGFPGVGGVGDCGGGLSGGVIDGEASELAAGGGCNSGSGSGGTARINTKITTNTTTTTNISPSTATTTTTNSTPPSTNINTNATPVPTTNTDTNTDSTTTTTTTTATTTTTTSAFSFLSGAQLEQAARLTLAGLHNAIKSARLRWRDVAHLRVYYLAPSEKSPRQLCPPLFGPGQGLPTAAAVGGGEGVDEGEMGVGGGVSGMGGGKEELLKRAFFLALAAATPERPAVTFVPVSGLAAASDADGAAVVGAAAAVMSVHATAWNLDRMRTEMWVRGQA